MTTKGKEGQKFLFAMTSFIIFLDIKRDKVNCYLAYIIRGFLLLPSLTGKSAPTRKAKCLADMGY